MLVLRNGGPEKPHKHGIGYKTKREGSQYMSAPIIKHSFASVFAVVHSTGYAPLSVGTERKELSLPRELPLIDASW